MGKTIEALIESRRVREAIIHAWGQVPESILRYDRQATTIDNFAPRSYQNSSNVTDETFKDQPDTHRLAKVFDISGKDVRSGALSRFPQGVGRILLHIYSETNCTVIDPFAGHNSRMELCWRLNRNYIGCDISHQFMIANREIAHVLRDEADYDLFGKEHYTSWIELHECDSRAMPIPDESGDFTITSPPYWCLEFYGDEPEQLGNLNYEEFLSALREVAKENYRCLRPGSFAIWCVNDFRKDGRFYPYHEHVAEILRSVGFSQFDTLITDLGPAIRAAFASQILETKIIPKRHEYCLVFQRPFTGTSKPRPAAPSAPLDNRPLVQGDFFPL